MKPVLLLIDLQNGFLSGELEPPGTEIVAGAADILAEWRQAGLPVVHIWTTITREPDNRMPHWQRNRLWNCVEGTEAHAVPTRLQPMDGEAIVDKTFFSAFSTGKLKAVLQNYAADTLVVAGVHLHGCVRATILDGYTLGYRVIVAADATGGYDGLHGAVSKRHLEGRACEFRGSREIMAEVRGSPVRDPASLSHVCPSDPRIVWRWPVSAALQVNEAFALARKAFLRWEESPVDERAGFLLQLAVRLEQEVEIFSELLVRQIGKPLTLARSEVERAVEILRSVVSVNKTYSRRAEETGWRRRALGVVTLITPFNNPLAIPIGKIAPALLFGNTVIWKPSIPGSDIALRVAALFMELGLPPGALQVVLGAQETGAECMERADAVSLSGSPAAGWVAREICARRMLPLQAELGGNNAAIVWRDADLPHAAAQIADGAFAFAGQRCTATRRVIVDSAIHDEFLGYLEGTLEKFQPDDPADPNTKVGPLISILSHQRLQRLVERAREAGCRVIPHTTSEMPPGWMAPVILCASDSSLEIVQEESFGPIIVVQRATDWKHALTLCNGVRQGLAGACFTKDTWRITDFLKRAACGILKINQSTAGAKVDIPFGGWKQSGQGPAEHGPANVEFFTRMQSVYLPAGPQT